MDKERMESQTKRLGKIIELDGDKFLLTLPSMTELTSLARIHNLIDVQYPYFATTKKHLMACEPLDVIPINADNGIWGSYELTKTYGGTLAVSRICAKYMGFRPMLIPLCQDETLDESVSQYHCNGDIVTGGTFFLDTVPIPMPEATELTAGYKMFKKTESEKEVLDIYNKSLNAEIQRKCWIGDTEPDKALRWIFANGVFILEQPVAFLSLATIYYQFCCG